MTPPLLADALVPPLLAIPPAVALMLIVAAHLSVTIHRTEPASRRRIRTANGVVMLTALPLLAAGFSILDPDAQRTTWILVWLAATALLALAVTLALADVLNTIRLANRARRRIRRDFRRRLADSIPRAGRKP